jgi:hypothetical protein
MQAMVYKMNRPLDRIHEYIEILKVCVVIVIEGPIYANIENTKVSRVIRSCKSKKDIQHNGHKKIDENASNGLQITRKKTNY